MDARSAPQCVLRAHPSNELAHLTNNSRPPWSAARFPAPICAKPRSMPTQDRVRLDNAGQTKQAWPKPSHPYQQCPVAPTELPLGCTPQGNIELMPKKDILKLKSAPRLEQVGDNCPKQMEHRNHRVDDELILPYPANRADGIFGNDRKLDELFEVAFEEARRRGRLPPSVEAESTPRYAIKRLG